MPWVDLTFCVCHVHFHVKLLLLGLEFGQRELFLFQPDLLLELSFGIGFQNGFLDLDLCVEHLPLHLFVFLDRSLVRHLCFRRPLHGFFVLLPLLRQLDHVRSVGFCSHPPPLLFFGFGFRGGFFFEPNAFFLRRLCRRFGFEPQPLLFRGSFGGRLLCFHPQPLLLCSSFCGCFLRGNACTLDLFGGGFFFGKPNAFRFLGCRFCCSLCCQALPLLLFGCSFCSSLRLEAAALFFFGCGLRGSLSFQPQPLLFGSLGSSFGFEPQPLLLCRGFGSRLFGFQPQPLLLFFGCFRGGGGFGAEPLLLCCRLFGRLFRSNADSLGFFGGSFLFGNAHTLRFLCRGLCSCFCLEPHPLLLCSGFGGFLFGGNPYALRFFRGSFLCSKPDPLCFGGCLGFSLFFLKQDAFLFRQRFGCCLFCFEPESLFLRRRFCRYLFSFDPGTFCFCLFGGFFGGCFCFNLGLFSLDPHPLCLFGGGFGHCSFSLKPSLLVGGGGGGSLFGQPLLFRGGSCCCLFRFDPKPLRLCGSSCTLCLELQTLLLFCGLLFQPFLLCCFGFCRGLCRFLFQQLLPGDGLLGSNLCFFLQPQLVRFRCSCCGGRLFFHPFLFGSCSFGSHASFVLDTEPFGFRRRRRRRRFFFLLFTLSLGREPGFFGGGGPCRLLLGGDFRGLFRPHRCTRLRFRPRLHLEVAFHRACGVLLIVTVKPYVSITWQR